MIILLHAASIRCAEKPVHEEPGYSGYEASVCEEPDPGYEGCYIVTEGSYPIMDDRAHGILYRVWSDAAEEQIGW